MLKNNNSTLSAIIFGFAAAFLWGLFPSVTKLGIASNLSPYDITALRFLVAGTLLFPLFYKKRLKGTTWTGALILSSGAGALYLLFVAGGLAFASAGHFGIIAPSCMLLFSTIGSVLLLKAKLNSIRIFGIAIIIIGITVIGWDSVTHSSGSSWIGDLMFIGGGFLWACYTLTLRVWPLDPLHATAIVSVVSMFLYLPAYFLFADVGIFSASISEVLFQGLLQGVIIAIVALLLYTRAVNILGAARGAVFGALVPATTLILAFPILGEIPNSYQLIGVTIVTIGMTFALELVKTFRPTKSSDKLAQ